MSLVSRKPAGFRSCVKLLGKDAGADRAQALVTNRPGGYDDRRHPAGSRLPSRPEVRRRGSLGPCRSPSPVEGPPTPRSPHLPLWSRSRRCAPALRSCVQRRVLRLFAETSDKELVYLEGVCGQALEVGEEAVTGAEVVYRKSGRRPIRHVSRLIPGVPHGHSLAHCLPSFSVRTPLLHHIWRATTPLTWTGYDYRGGRLDPGKDMSEYAGQTTGRFTATIRGRSIPGAARRPSADGTSRSCW
jgi:hypothetical protein